MKLTKREKILLAFLLVLLSAFLYHRFVFQPERSKIEELQEEYTQKLRIFNQVKRKDERMYEIKGEIQKLQSDLSTMNKKIAMPIYVPEVLREMDRTAVQKGVQVDSIAFSGNASAVKGEALNNNTSVNANMTAVTAVQNALAQNSSQSVAAAAQSTIEQNATVNGSAQNNQTKGTTGLNTLVIQFSFQGNYANCIEFIKYYENNDRLFRVDSFEISGNSDKCSGRASLTAFAIPNNDPKFKYEVDAGAARPNPFK